MQQLLSVYKPTGLTPLEVINIVKKHRPELANEKITYAGRLDPLAHGVLLLLIGEEAKKKDMYLSLPKSYEFEILFGRETDTYDLLGYVKETKIKSEANVNLFVNKFVNNHIGKQLQFYPPYSSKTVNGKPLFWWARNDRLDEIEIPKREIEIFEFNCLWIGEITTTMLKKKIQTSIASVHGDFRQKEIGARWEQIFNDLLREKKIFQTATFSVKCSSGTYVRELVHQLGKEMGCGAVALNILRTSVGEYSVADAMKLNR